MSLMRPVLNAWLRWTEKPHLARTQDAVALRRSFETKARFYFRAPWGTRFESAALEGVPVLHVNPSKVGPVILHVHGGAFVMGSPRTHRAMLACLSRDADVPACLVKYRLAPEHTHPAALDDVLACYRALMDRPEGVILGGDSAGGALVLAALAEILRQGMPRPRGVFAFSPITDLTLSGDSVTRNAEAEVILPVARAHETLERYLQGTDPRDPKASPLYADFDGAGSVWLCAGDTEILLDDTRRMADRLRAQGVVVTEVIAHDLPHVWPMFHNLLPEGRATLRDLAVWINSLSRTKGDS
ncbi:alpha/beta hydrolase [Antarctobacter heliothermus]|uniref:Acetyl esterase/lipase n=1 Tax=Antarctobacter heliothermus TaxID=74033 RepID=A0A239C2J5_9RHOB|nr:alpha/beta hydrolase [Antarctobacter heliothermus]SNS14139.1 Acetyl esterase/lipase [Antarctobacter heliothermus]